MHSLFIHPNDDVVIRFAIFDLIVGTTGSVNGDRSNLFAITASCRLLGSILLLAAIQAVSGSATLRIGGLRTGAP